MKCAAIGFQLIILLFVHIGLYARYCALFEPRSRQALFSKINQSDLAVVQFYQKVGDKKSVQRYYHLLRERMQSVASNSQFSYARTTFILMEMRLNDCLAQDLGISNLPTIMLFFQGRPLTNNGMPVQLVGIASEIQINQFIVNYAGRRVKEAVESRAEYEREKEAAQWAAWSAWGPYWYGGYYRPCYWNWGCGLGLGCAWRGAGWCW